MNSTTSGGQSCSVNREHLVQEASGAGRCVDCFSEAKAASQFMNGTSYLINLASILSSLKRPFYLVSLALGFSCFKTNLDGTDSFTLLLKSGVLKLIIRLG